MTPKPPFIYLITGFDCWLCYFRYFAPNGAGGEGSTKIAGAAAIVNAPFDRDRVRWTFHLGVLNDLVF
jgi:hypothetical protein